MAEPDGVRLPRVLGELRSAVAADGAALYLDDGDGALALAAVSGAEPAAQSWRRRLLGRDPASRLLVVPIPDAAGGVVVLERAGRADFTRDDRALAKIYARQLAARISVEGTFGHSVWTRQLEAIQRIAAQLTRLASVEQVAAAICRETRRVIDYDEAHVLLNEPVGRLRSLAAVAGPAGDEPARELGHDSHVGHAIAHAVTRAVPLLAPDLSDPAPGRCGEWSLVAVPLRYEQRVSGVICLLKEGTAQFDDDDLRLLQILSDQVAVAIENAKLLAGRDELVRELNALLDVSTAANQPTDERTLATSLAGKIRRASRMDGAVVWRCEDGATTLRLLASDNVTVPATADALASPARRAVLRDGRPHAVAIVPNEEAARSADVTAHAVTDGPASPSEEASRTVPPLPRTAVSLPLIVAGRTIGLIELYSFDASRTLGELEIQAYLTMAGSVASGLENVRLLEQLRLAADVDQVTGVNNHRYLQERLGQEVARAARLGSRLCVLMLDLDNFKPVNDRHGHADGDRVLRSVAACIRSNVRTGDIVARYGGDEFVVVMPDTPAEQAREVAGRVVAGILGRRHELAADAAVTVGASAGLAVYPDDGHTAAALLHAADAAMYESKRAQQPKAERGPAELLARPLSAPAG